jgi:hypothetical protein
MDLRSNSCFVIGAALTGSHYKTYIISSMRYLRSDLVGLLVLWMVAYNGQASILYYKSFRTMQTLLRMDNISGRPYMIVTTYKELVSCVKIFRRLSLVVYILSTKQYF